MSLSLDPISVVTGCVSGILCLNNSFSCCVCLREPLKSLGIGGFGSSVGLVDYRFCNCGEECWSSLPVHGLPAGWQRKLRQVGKVSEVLQQGLRPRDWSVQLGNWSVTSWSTLYSSSLCVRDTLLVRSVNSVCVNDPILVSYHSLRVHWHQLLHKPKPATSLPEGLCIWICYIFNFQSLIITIMKLNDKWPEVSIDIK